MAGLAVTPSPCRSRPTLQQHTCLPHAYLRTVSIPQLMPCALQYTLRLMLQYHTSQAYLRLAVATPRVPRDDVLLFLLRRELQHAFVWSHADDRLPPAIDGAFHLRPPRKTWSARPNVVVAGRRTETTAKHWLVFRSQAYHLVMERVHHQCGGYDHHLSAICVLAECAILQPRLPPSRHGQSR
eukprot:COSAG06_NODE_11244_length_1539_cov_1.884028_1_plen_183_part_00